MQCPKRQWTHGCGYGMEYQQNPYQASTNLAQIAQMRRSHIEDVISSTTLIPSPGPSRTNVTTPPPQSMRTAGEPHSEGPTPTVTAQAQNESIRRNVILDATLLSPDAQKLRIGDGPQIPLYSAQKLKIRPYRTRSIRTDVYWEFPDNTYGEIRASGRERFREKGIDVIRQKVSNVPINGLSVLLHNTTDKLYSLNIKDSIGEIIIVQVLQPIIRAQFEVDNGNYSPPTTSQQRN